MTNLNAQPETAGKETKLYIPAIAGLYDYTRPLSWPVVRIAVGWNLFVHGWPHILTPTMMAPGFAKMGFSSPEIWSILSALIEFGGGVAIILGFLTRFFAAAVAIEMLAILSLYWGNGFSWLGHGYEYVLMWGLVSFAIALRGGGPYSIDGLIGREL